MYKFFILLVFATVLNSCSKTSKERIVVKNFEILCEQELLDSIYVNFEPNIYIPIKFIANGDTIPAIMRIRGDSSREYDKKSLKIVFAKDSIPEGETRKINLNSEWTDVTYIRQYLSSVLIEQAGVKVYKSNFVALKLNGSFWGVYLQVENMDKHFLKRNYLDAKGSLYKATEDGACLSSFDNIDIKWEKKTNKKTDWDDLQQLITMVDTLQAQYCKSFLLEHFEYNKFISLVALNMLLQNGSTYYHNYYLYHDINGNGKWQIFPWDMDKTLSFYNYKPFRYHETSSNWESDNPLIEKSLLCKPVMNDIKARLTELEDNIFNKKHIYPLLDACKKELAPYVAKDTTDKIRDLKAWKKALKFEKEFIKRQPEYILSQIEDLPELFELKQIKEPVLAPVVLQWKKSGNKNNITYEVLYGTDFLLENESTKRITNVSDTFCVLNKLNAGKYYWRVYASDGTNKVEGFNSKSVFEVKPASRTLITHDTILLKKNSPHFINNTWVIKPDVVLTIEPGCKLLMDESANINNYGKLLAIGNSLDSIYFLPKNLFWGTMVAFGKNAELQLKNCKIKDGLLQSRDAGIVMNNCDYIIENKSLIIDGERNSIMWAYGGAFFIDSCSFMNCNISIGEGFNVHRAKVNVLNSTFNNIADAIEYINVSDGSIVNNVIYNSPDDAIDLNGCKNILIANNLIVNNTDKAISIGTEQFGPSTGIVVRNNYLTGNNIGISVKDSSFCTIESTTFFRNKTAVEAYLKNNEKAYMRGGTAEISFSAFIDNSQNLKVDDHSIVKVSESVSNTQSLKNDNVVINWSGINAIDVFEGDCGMHVTPAQLLILKTMEKTSEK